MLSIWAGAGGGESDSISWANPRIALGIQAFAFRDIARGGEYAL
jgi:hypothetical protein